LTQTDEQREDFPSGRPAQARVVASASRDVFFNLALEDRLFRGLAPGERLLFLWRNDPAVVVGRYQNPWIECRLSEMEREGVVLARRQSGGGAVYHDGGNLCMTFMGPKAGYDRRANIDLVVGILRAAGVDAEANERNDVLAAGRKVSGSAYRECADRAFHHATLLFHADLDRLTRFLRPGTRFDAAKGTASVRSPVANLRDLGGPAVEDFSGLLAGAFAPGSPVRELGEEAADAELAALRERWSGWDWIYGSCPEFTVSLEDGADSLKIPVKGGRFSLPEPIDFSPRNLAAALDTEAVRLGASGDQAGAERCARFARRAAEL
jgi:lipoate-protein ligase A